MFNNFNFLTDIRTIYYMLMQFILFMYPLKTYGDYKLGKTKFYYCIISAIIFFAFNYLFLSYKYQ